MHLSALALTLTTLLALPLSSAYLYSEHAAAQRPSWRSLISRGPCPTSPAPNSDAILVQCIKEEPTALRTQGQDRPSWSGPRRTILNKSDLAIAQNKLIRFCASGQSISRHGGRIESSNEVAVQLCNRSGQPVTCDREGVVALFEAITCGSHDAPLMGFAAPVPESSRTLGIKDAEVVLSLGSVEEIAGGCGVKEESSAGNAYAYRSGSRYRTASGP